DPPTSASQVSEITGMCHHVQLNATFMYTRKPDDLCDLLYPNWPETSGNPPASASQSAGITGVCHYAQLSFLSRRGTAKWPGLALN
ncbi:hypothetical protein GW7_16415, partial [Heterocephalus glaber]